MFSSSYQEAWDWWKSKRAVTGYCCRYCVRKDNKSIRFPTGNGVKPHFARSQACLIGVSRTARSRERMSSPLHLQNQR